MVLTVQPFHVQYMMSFKGLVDNAFIIVYVWAVIADIVTGWVKSLRKKNTNSTKGLNGLLKHSVLMLIILTLYPILDVLGWKNTADALVVFYVLFYLVSIIENLGQMGLPVPEWIKRYLYKLSDEYNAGTKDKK